MKKATSPTPPSPVPQPRPTLAEVEREVVAESREWGRQRLQERLQQLAQDEGQVPPPRPAPVPPLPRHSELGAIQLTVDYGQPRFDFITRRIAPSENPFGIGKRHLCRHFSAMPQSLSAVYIHLIFSTKDRRPFLRDKPTRDALHSYLGGVSKQLDCPPLHVGGVEDHVHLLARFGRTLTQTEWVKELKRVSNLWLKRPRICRLRVARRLRGFLREPIQPRTGEAIHSRTHRKIGFQDELRALLKRHEIEWDEKHVWE